MLHYSSCFAISPLQPSLRNNVISNPIRVYGGRLDFRWRLQKVVKDPIRVYGSTIDSRWTHCKVIEIPTWVYGRKEYSRLHSRWRHCKVIRDPMWVYGRWLDSRCTYCKLVIAHVRVYGSRSGSKGYLCAEQTGRWLCADQHGAHTAPCCGCQSMPVSVCSESAQPAPSPTHCNSTSEWLVTHCNTTRVPLQHHK